MDTSEHGHITPLELLAESKLHQQKWDTKEEQSNAVREEEEGSAIFVGQIWEPPEISKTDGGTNGSKNERWPVQPSLSLDLACFLFFIFPAVQEALFTTHNILKLITFYWLTLYKVEKIQILRFFYLFHTSIYFI